MLTLFAIAYEMRRQNIPESLEPLDVTLLVGLPPAHYGRQHTNFEAYFLRKREVVDFEFNGDYHSIRINKVTSFPRHLPQLRPDMLN